MLKKVFFLLLSILPFVTTSCGGDDEPDYTSYTANVGDTYDFSVVGIDMELFECSGAGDKYASHLIPDIRNGASETFKAKPKSAKVKVFLKMYNRKTGNVQNRWVKEIFVLENGKNTKIGITEKTMMSDSEPY